MSWVLPGLELVFAKPFTLVSILMREDLPTLLRPINAYSGLLSEGHFLWLVLLTMNSALFISIVGSGFFSFSCFFLLHSFLSAFFDFGDMVCEGFLFGGDFLFPPRKFLDIDFEESSTVEEFVASFVGFEVALTFFGVKVAKSDEDAGFVDITEVVCHCGAKRSHGGREVHVCIDERWDGGAEIANAVDESLVVVFVVAAFEGAVKFVEVGFDLSGFERPHKAVAVGEVFLVEVEDEVFCLRIHLWIHGDFAEEVAGFGYFHSEAADAIP